MTAGSKRMSSSSVLPLPLFVIIASLLLLSLIVSSHALKCKCTQSSPVSFGCIFQQFTPSHNSQWQKVPCIDGVCEVPSASSSCLMLGLSPTHAQPTHFAIFHSHFCCRPSQLRTALRMLLQCQLERGRMRGKEVQIGCKCEGR
jgi:hypothetical protein